MASGRRLKKIKKEKKKKKKERAHVLKMGLGARAHYVRAWGSNEPRDLSIFFFYIIFLNFCFDPLK